MEPRTVYADNAAATRLSEEALAAMLPFCTEQYANPSSQYPFAAAAKKALESARETLAGLLGACPDEIVFTSGGTESDNLAVLGAVRAAPRGKRHLIVSAVEHPAVLRAAERLSREGCSVTVLPVDGTGRVSPAGLAAAMRPDTALVSVMTANNEVGTVQPVEELAAVARRGGALFHTDAVQAAGQLALDVRRTGVDLMSLSAHKFNGPKGAGLLFVRRGTPVERLFEGGGQELGRRGGTENVPGAVGMAAALAHASAGLAAERARLTALRRRLEAGILAIPGARLTGHPEDRLPGLCSAVFSGVEGEALALLLGLKGICVSAGAACSAGSPEPSHVLTALGLDRALALGALRISLGRYSTDGDVDAILDELPRAAAALGALSADEPGGAAR